MNKESTQLQSATYSSSRDVIIRCGLELLTEQGFGATGLEAVLKKAMVPKGSFYHYFKSKEEFGIAVIDAYDAYFSKKIDRILGDSSRKPLDRLRDFIQDASAGMAKHNFKRGCLVGNLSQEVSVLPPAYQLKLEGIFQDWQTKVANCLFEAQAQGDLKQDQNCEDLAEFFWIAWEGAVLRARLMRNVQPITTFSQIFFHQFISRK
jgi:TetR/AcrR family transcriptional repressor of nem operon